MSFVLDLAAGFTFAWALLEGVAFSCAFPRPVDVEALLQFIYAKDEQDKNWIPPSLRKVLNAFPHYNRSLVAWRDGSVRRFAGFVQSRQALPVLGLVLATAALVARLPGTAGKPQLPPALGWLLMVICSVPVLALIAVTLIWSLRTGSSDERHKIFWLYWGAYTAFWLPALANQGALWWAFFRTDEGAYALFSWSFIMGFPVAVLLGVLALALAIFFRGALDPRLAITRTSVIGVLGLAFPPLVLVLQRILELGVVVHLGLPRHSGLWAAVGLSVFVFKPVSRRLEHFVEEKLEQWLPASALAGAERAVSVIGFADLSGYTVLSAQDERAALTHASALHKAARQAVQANHSRLVKTLGDAVMWESAAATEAVAVCRALQSEYAVFATAEKLSPLSMHFGLHRGEVVRAKDGDVFGSTVNIASRLVGQAQPGDIVVSGTVSEAMTASHVAVEALGIRQLKNVPDPIACFRIKTG